MIPGVGSQIEDLSKFGYKIPKFLESRTTKKCSPTFVSLNIKAKKCGELRTTVAQFNREGEERY